MTPTILLAALLGSPPLPDLGGTWASVQVAASVVDLPIVGELRSRTVATGLVQVQQRGEALVLRETLCALDTSSPTPLVETRYSQAFVTAMSGSERAGALGRRGSELHLEVGGPPRTVGAEVEPGAPLPVLPSDPRVRDPDGDGAPGLSVRVEGLVSGEVYFVQRGWTQLAGRVRSPERIEGAVTWATEEALLGATNEHLLRRPPVRPDPGRSFFRMRRVEPGLTCSALLSRRRVLLGM